MCLLYLPAHWCLLQGGGAHARHTAWFYEKLFSNSAPPVYLNIQDLFQYLLNAALHQDSEDLFSTWLEFQPVSSWDWYSWKKPQIWSRWEVCSPVAMLGLADRLVFVCFTVIPPLSYCSLPLNPCAAQPFLLTTCAPSPIANGNGPDSLTSVKQISGISQHASQ